MLPSLFTTNSRLSLSHAALAAPRLATLLNSAEDELPRLQQVLKLPLSPLPAATAANPMSAGQSGGREAVGPQQHQEPSASSGSQHSYPHESRQPSRNYDQLQRFYEEKQRSLCGDKEGMPLIVSINRSVSAIADRPISLAAEFCCHPRPRKVFWIHRHLALAPGRIIGPYITKDLVPVSPSIHPSCACRSRPALCLASVPVLVVRLSESSCCCRQKAC